MESTSPTRMNLLVRRKQIKIAEQGVNLLKSKRDALMQEFMELIKPLLEERKNLDHTITRALKTLAVSLGIDGKESLESAALASWRRYLFKIGEKKVWGVRLPEIEGDTMRRSVISRGYAPISISSRIDLTADAFEHVIDQIIQMAPREIKLKRLGGEIKKTSRRVNALEQRLIPRLKGEVKFIRQVLEDREREDKFRLKRIKAKHMTVRK